MFVISIPEIKKTLKKILLTSKKIYLKTVNRIIAAQIYYGTGHNIRQQLANAPTPHGQPSSTFAKPLPLP